uniref:Glycosyltransferase family 4 protein n=1 Tax=Roseihalotalea indica TaxID=2867963 RepID=A0AA49JIW3_9BACT|nr:glycosyltransferase family 4 protein [Tunicatimonas sp. TK19036]
MPALKILHLSSEVSWRGGEQQMAYLIAELQQYSVEPLVACREDSAFAKFCRQQSWKYIPLPFRNSFDLKTALVIKQICKKEQIDLIHIHSGKSHGIAVLAATLGNRTPLILSRRVDFPVRQNWLTQWKYNHPQIKKIICVSKAIEEIVRASIEHPNRCTTVHSGVDSSRFIAPNGYLRRYFSIPEDNILIGNSSALANHKDYYTFVDTAALVTTQYPNATFFIIGDGPEKQNIQYYISQKNMEKQVRMTGFLANIEEVLPELDIFLMTSQTEGLGTSILDAFACRIPVVSTNAGGIPEMVKHESTGLLAPVKDPEKLAQNILRLIHHPPLQRQLTDQAYQILQDQFTFQRMANKTWDIYCEIVSGNN